MGKTGIAAVDAAVVWSVAVVAIAGLVGLVGRGILRAVRGVARAATRVDQIADDWAGTPARPGVPERPGVMERLGGIEDRTTSIDDRITSIDARLTSVEHELHPNSGTSLRDAVDRVDVALNGSPPPPP
ncbi:hypothetical protein KQY30_20205 [Streptomyces sp. GMY02]|uniref:hypothetical protein n=1 Tax=Streptomyces sp. GMY02 TaxID=1333528 RepID=UPI001C2C8BD0|nr:hypothetical protein [Streptomyces sp. GMY02]QXE36221.1 hypothetical protein KQY30_20205 [Streptomyces sp. GMY02]